ncbi:MAG: adenosylcobinamide amidohydrolase [Archaeoglobaceae archaeon]
MPYKNYCIDDRTLLVHGKFFGVSTGLLGGWRSVECAFNHCIDDDFYRISPVAYLKKVAKSYGLKKYFGLLTAVPMENLSIKSVENVTAFVTAGVNNPNKMTINAILVAESKLSRSALLNAIITATEAKSSALFKLGYRFTGTNTDAVVVLSTMKGSYETFSGPASRLGKRIWETVFKATIESLKKWEKNSRNTF